MKPRKNPLLFLLLFLVPTLQRGNKSRIAPAVRDAKASQAAFPRSAWERVRSFLVLCLLVFSGLAFATPTTPTSDFIDNGDGTVTHKTTGIMWMRCAMGQTWNNASKQCDGTAQMYTYDQAPALKTTFAGKSDWRLPNQTELTSIVERDNYNPAINTGLFPNSPSDWYWYWSASPVAYSSGSAWAVGSYNGDGDWGNKDSKLFVRLVRAGQCFGDLRSSTTPSSDFIDNQDGTVTHKCTGLVWQRCSVGQTWNGTSCTGTAQTYTYDQALALKTSFAGNSDWRLPNANELHTIVEYGSYNPAINTALFPNTPDNYYWSASPVAGSSYYAWIVYFDYGYGSWDGKGSSYFVRLVRGKWSSNPQSTSYDIINQTSIALDFAKNYDAKNAKTIELKNTSAQAIKVANVVVSDANNYWVNLFVDTNKSCRAANYASTIKNFIIPANSSCTISIGFSPFDNKTKDKTINANISLKMTINKVVTNKVIKVTGIGRAQVANAYNKSSSLWGQCTWGVSELKGGNPPINTSLVGASNFYSSAKYWYGGVLDSNTQKTNPAIGNVVVFSANSASSNGHVGMIIQTSPVVTMLSMNDIGGVRKWSVRPIDWYPSQSATWSPLMTGVDAQSNIIYADQHYGFIDWNSDIY
jgi:hypothetical protein